MPGPGVGGGGSVEQMGPALTEMSIGDDPAAWERAGFAVVDQCVVIGSVTVRLAPPGESGQRGVLGWSFDGIDSERSLDSDAIDGIPTVRRAGSRDADTIDSTDRTAHPNGVTGVDHVVVMTDDLERTSAALEATGFEPRRRRAIPKSDPPRSQIFWWAGDVIIELVGPDTPIGDKPASIWGLAITAPELETAAALLGDTMSPPRDAVQKGRRIASLRGSALDLSVPIALMTPHL